MQRKTTQTCNNTESCLQQYAPKRLTFPKGDFPNFQSCDCEQCPQSRLGSDADFLQIFWFYWPYDGILNKYLPASLRKADWEPLFIVYHPEAAEFFLLTTLHWKYICWGAWSEYNLRFFKFWHSPLIEGTLREKINERLENIYENLKTLVKGHLKIMRGLERLAFYCRKIIGRTSQSVEFTPISCLSAIPNMNPKRDPEEPSSSLETRQKCIKLHEIKEAISDFRKLTQF